MADYLAAEALIIARLQAQIANTPVLSAADLAGVEETKQVTPALHVLYLGDRLIDAQGRGRAQTVAQTWMVVVAVRNARDQGKGKEARGTAGPFIDSVLSALSGWAPSISHSELARVNAPARPLYGAGGYAYFPLAFETQIETLGTG